MKEEDKQDIINSLLESSFSSVNNMSPKVFELNEDVKVLVHKISDYFDLHYPNVQFKTFYDKPFLDTMKFIIKNEEIFKNFLEYVHYKGLLRLFVHTAVYICPQVFTTAINKIIREYATSEVFQNSDNGGYI